LNISWDQFFLGLAVLTSLRSKDPNTKVGACIVSKNNIIQGLGYNGFPRGCDESNFSWEKCGEYIDTKYPYVVHAEANAILNSNSSNLVGSTLYSVLFPCNECAKLIIQSGINKIVYCSDKYSTIPIFLAARKMFNVANIELVQMSFETITLKGQ